MKVTYQELCVNDKNVLSARTQFNSPNNAYTPSFYANGAASIENIEINDEGIKLFCFEMKIVFVYF